MRARPDRIEIPHRRACFAVLEVQKGVWARPWAGVLADPPTVFADAWGKGRGHRVWLRFACNDPQCPAVLRLRADSVLANALGGP